MHLGKRKPGFLVQLWVTGGEFLKFSEAPLFLLCEMRSLDWHWSQRLHWLLVLTLRWPHSWNTGC